LKACLQSPFFRSKIFLRVPRSPRPRVGQNAKSIKPALESYLTPFLFPIPF
jgi:hypothetical protein